MLQAATTTTGCNNYDGDNIRVKGSLLSRGTLKGNLQSKATVEGRLLSRGTLEGNLQSKARVEGRPFEGYLQSKARVEGSL